MESVITVPVTAEMMAWAKANGVEGGQEAATAFFKKRYLEFAIRKAQMVGDTPEEEEEKRYYQTQVRVLNINDSFPSAPGG